MVIHKSNDLLFTFLLDEDLVQFWLSQTSIRPKPLPPPATTHIKQKQKKQLKLKTPKTVWRKPKKEKEENKQEITD